MRVAIHEFKSHLSQYVGSAQNGEVIELTAHRKIVARLIGIPSSSSDGLANILASGIAHWQGGKPSGADITLERKGKTVSTMVLEDRH